jgi:hypothetical protein
MIGRIVTVVGIVCLAGMWGGCDDTATAPHGDIDPGEQGVVLLEPNTARTFQVGDTVRIRWATSFEHILSGVTFAYSHDNGRSWSQIDPDTSGLIKQESELYEGNIGTWRWVIPSTMESDLGLSFSTVSQQALIKVLAPYDTEPETQNWYEDACDEPLVVLE